MSIITSLILFIFVQATVIAAAAVSSEATQLKEDDLLIRSDTIKTSRSSSNYLRPTKNRRTAGIIDDNDEDNGEGLLKEFWSFTSFTYPDDDKNNNNDEENDNGSIIETVKIVGGTDVPKNKYPFYVNWDGRCGASLIARDIILSAAHCNPVRSNKVRINMSDNDDNRGIVRYIVERRPHPNYNARTTNYDYMIMKLNEPVPSGIVETIDLNDDGDIPSRSQVLTVIGFGALSEGGYQSDTLQEVDVRYVPTEQCNTNQSYDGKVDDRTMFCAGTNDNRDSCQGDSGGPIFYEKPNGRGYKQVGIVSWGRGCAQRRYPGVYSRISGQYTWMRSQICQMTTTNYCRDDNNDDNNQEEEESTTITDSNSNDDDGTTVSIRLDIYYDKYEYEIGWFFEQDGIVQLTKIPNSSSEEVGEATQYRLRLQPGKNALFTITDSFGDGFAGYGGYQIYAEMTDDDTILLVTSDGDFTRSEVEQFTVPTLPPSSSANNNDNEDEEDSSLASSVAPSLSPSTNNNNNEDEDESIPSTTAVTTFSPTQPTPSQEQSTALPIDNINFGYQCDSEEHQNSMNEFLFQNDEDKKKYIIEFVKFENENDRIEYHSYVQSLLSSNNREVVYYMNPAWNTNPDNPVLEWDEAIIIQLLNNTVSINSTTNYWNTKRNNNGRIWMATLNTDIIQKYPNLVVNPEDTTKPMFMFLHLMKIRNQTSVDVFDEQTQNAKTSNGIYVKAWLDIASQTCIGDDEDFDQLRIETIRTLKDYGVAVNDPNWATASEYRMNGIQTDKTTSAFANTLLLQQDTITNLYDGIL